MLVSRAVKIPTTEQLENINCFYWAARAMSRMPEYEQEADAALKDLEPLKPLFAGHFPDLNKTPPERQPRWKGEDWE